MLSVAENIMTCLWCGVDLKISWTSRRMSVSVATVVSEVGRERAEGYEEQEGRERKEKGW